MATVINPYAALNDEQYNDLWEASVDRMTIQFGRFLDYRKAAEGKQKAEAFEVGKLVQNGGTYKQVTPLSLNDIRMKVEELSFLNRFSTTDLAVTIAAIANLIFGVMAAVGYFGFMMPTIILWSSGTSLIIMSLFLLAFDCYPRYKRGLACKKIIAELAEQHVIQAQQAMRTIKSPHHFFAKGWLYKRHPLKDSALVLKVIETFTNQIETAQALESVKEYYRESPLEHEMDRSIARTVKVMTPRSKVIQSRNRKSCC